MKEEIFKKASFLMLDIMRYEDQVKALTNMRNNIQETNINENDIFFECKFYNENTTPIMFQLSKPVIESMVKQQLEIATQKLENVKKEFEEL